LPPILFFFRLLSFVRISIIIDM